MMHGTEEYKISWDIFNKLFLLLFLITTLLKQFCYNKYISPLFLSPINYQNYVCIFIISCL